LRFVFSGLTFPRPSLIIRLGKNKPMPKGVYKHKKMSERSPEVQATMARCLAAGRTTEVRERVRHTLKANATEEWRKKVSEATREALHRPNVRMRHLMSMMGRACQFKGGNGQVPVEKVLELARKLEPLGFIREFPVKTAGHKTGLNVPTNYKVDFGHPLRMIAVEVDGPCHKTFKAKAQDEKKTIVLNALGWTVARVKH
jgi:hypothetical protein